MSLVFFLCPFLLKLQSRSEGLRHCVSSEENAIQVDPLPPGQCWVLQINFARGDGQKSC